MLKFSYKVENICEYIVWTVLFNFYIAQILSRLFNPDCLLHACIGKFSKSFNTDIKMYLQE